MSYRIGPETYEFMMLYGDRFFENKHTPFGVSWDLENGYIKSYWPLKSNIHFIDLEIVSFDVYWSAKRAMSSDSSPDKWKDKILRIVVLADDVPIIVFNNEELFGTPKEPSTKYLFISEQERRTLTGLIRWPNIPLRPIQ